MKSNNNESIWSNNQLIDLKNDDWLARQRVAGKIAAKTLILLKKIVEDGSVSTAIELDKIAEEFILKNGGIPTFKNYKGYPNSCCISIEKQLVHAIATDYKFKKHDMVSLDLGVTVEGAIADTALTTCFIEPKSEAQIKLIKSTEEALMRGIKAITVGKRLGCIGDAIYKYSKNLGYGLITNYGGHSLTWNNPHASPFVSNKASCNEGIRLQKNITLAIEPMLCFSSTKTWVDKDGWTVWCDADMSAHTEHTIYIHENYVEIITSRENL